MRLSLKLKLAGLNLIWFCVVLSLGLASVWVLRDLASGVGVLAEQKAPLLLKVAEVKQQVQSLTANAQAFVSRSDESLVAEAKATLDDLEANLAELAEETTGQAEISDDLAAVGEKIEAFKVVYGRVIVTTAKRDEALSAAFEQEAQTRQALADYPSQARLKDTLHGAVSQAMRYLASGDTAAGRAAVDQMNAALDTIKAEDQEFYPELRKKLGAPVFKLRREFERATQENEAIRADVGELTRVSDEVLAIVGELANSVLGQVASTTTAIQQRSESTSRLFYLALPLLFVLGLVLSVFSLRSVLKPVRQVIGFASEVSHGDLDASLDSRGLDVEMVQLADAIGAMVGTLKEKFQEVAASCELAEGESAKAREALAEAEEQREKARQAETQGRQAAAGELSEIVGGLSSDLAALREQILRVTDGANQARQRLTDTRHSTEAMNGAILEVAQSASVTAEHTDATRHKAAEGSGVVEQTVVSIGAVTEQSDALNRNMAVLGAKAEEIGKVIDVINDIADQTNLLALNAAIEAARAGEAGRGFAVVADEVRKLAEKTMTATKEVTGVIHSIQQATRDNASHVTAIAGSVAESDGLVKQSGTSLAEIVSFSESAAGMVQDIAASAEEQSAACDHINAAVSEVSDISSQTAEDMREASGAVDRINELSHRLSTMIERMRQG